MMRTIKLLLAALLVAGLTGWAYAAPNEVPKLNMEKAFNLSMPFVVNEGQIPNPSVSFYAKTFGGTLYVTKEGEMVYVLAGAGRPVDQSTSRTGKENRSPDSLVGAVGDIRGPVKEKIAPPLVLKEKLIPAAGRGVARHAPTFFAFLFCSLPNP